MKYEKAQAEVITFSGMGIFMIDSGDTASAIEAAKEKFGFDELNCPSVTYAGGNLSCSGVTYHRTGEMVHWGPNQSTWKIE